MDRGVRKKALESIAADARRAAIKDRLPEEKRPSPAFMVTVGIGDDPDREDYDKATDDDPTFDERPAMGRALTRPKRGSDPDAEVHDFATDDDPTYPGAIRRRRR